MLLFSVLVWGTLTQLHSAEVEARLCTYHMKGSGTITHPGSPKRKSLPKKYHPVPSEEFCIAYGSIKWTHDIEFTLIKSTVEIVEIDAEPHKVQGLLIPRYIPPFSEIDYIEYRAQYEYPPFVLTNTTILQGNEFAQFKILFPKESNISIVYRSKRKQRKFLCPSLEPQFDVISCTNGKNKNSECTFRCKDNYAPSPLLHHDIKILEIDQLGKTLPNISSVCSQTHDGKPIWNPDVIGWEVFYGWRQDLQTTCMSYEQLALHCSSHLYDDVNHPCRYYPEDLLLEIYDQKTDEVYVRPPTTTPPAFTLDPSEFGLENLNSAEIEWILEQLVHWRRQCQDLLEIIESVIKTNVDLDEMTIRHDETREVLTKLQNSFEFVCTTMSCSLPPHPCDDYCKTDGVGYSPRKCGAFRNGRRNCMRCRFLRKECSNRSFGVSC